MKIYLVEDSINIRELIHFAVQEKGGTVIGHSATEKKAVRSILVLKPQVVIVDPNLSEGSGIEVILEIKKIESGLVVIVLTNQDREQYEEACSSAGADYFLEKNSKDYPLFEKLLGDLSDVYQKAS